MHNHHHCGCQHELKFCPCCDTVYCTKCGVEWKKNIYYYNYPSWISYATGGSPNQTIGGVTIGTITTTQGCVHNIKGGS